MTAHLIDSFVGIPFPNFGVLFFESARSTYYFPNTPSTVSNNDKNAKTIPHHFNLAFPFQAGIMANANEIPNQPGQSPRIKKPEKKNVMDTAKQILVRL